MRTSSLVATCLAAALIAAPVAAKPTAKSVTQTFYLHGVTPIGEADIPETSVNSNWYKMDTTAPESGPPKSMFVTNYVAGPNGMCSGNGLLPVWRGTMSGKFKGDITVTLNTVGAPLSTMVIDLFADASGGCNSSATGAMDYIDPIATETVVVAPGPAVTEVTFKGVRAEAVGGLVLQLRTPGADTSQIRVLFDSADYASSISLTCKTKACVKV